MIERKHGENPGAAAQAVNAQTLALQFHRGFDLRVSGKRAGQSIDKAGDKDEIGSLGDGAEVGRRDRAPMEQRLSGAERRHADGTVTHLHQSDVEPVLAEVTLILGNVQRPFPFTRGARGDENFGQRRCRVNGRVVEN